MPKGKKLPYSISRLQTGNSPHLYDPDDFFESEAMESERYRNHPYVNRAKKLNRRVDEAEANKRSKWLQFRGKGGMGGSGLPPLKGPSGRGGGGSYPGQTPWSNLQLKDRQSVGTDPDSAVATTHRSLREEEET